MLQTSLPRRSEQKIEAKSNVLVTLFRWLLQFILMVGLVMGALAFMSRSMEQKTEQPSRSFTRERRLW